MVNQYQKLVWESSPEKIQVGKYQVKVNDKNIPNSVTEDIRGFSLHPNYSIKQQQRINRLRIRKVKDGYRKLKSTHTQMNINVPVSKQVLIKSAYNEEVGQ
jgi:hypothetical protein